MLVTTNDIQFLISLRSSNLTFQKQQIWPVFVDFTPKLAKLG